MTSVKRSEQPKRAEQRDRYFSHAAGQAGALQTAARRRRKKTVALFAGIAILVLAICVRPLFAGVLWRGLQPLFALRDATARGISYTLAPFGNAARLSAENATLKASLAEAELRAADRDVLYQENKTLKEELGRTDASVAENSILAGVISRPPALPYDTFMIDAGRDRGITASSTVWAGAAQIGIVSDIYPTTSRVELFSSAGKRTDALLGTIPMTIEGQGSGTFVAKVPVGVVVSMGDPVSLPGVTGGLVATVVRVDAPVGDALKTVYLQAPANVFDTKFVTVLLHISAVDNSGGGSSPQKIKK